MQSYDLNYLRLAVEIARKARDHGNHPFGAVLADAEGKFLLEAENTVVTTQDSTAHAETNLVRLASQRYDPEFLAGCTLYASTEPCPMCAGAIFWSNIRRVVFGLSEEGLYTQMDQDRAEVLLLPCRAVFQEGNKPIEVLGPLLEEEAVEVHSGFWR